MSTRRVAHREQLDEEGLRHILGHALPIGDDLTRELALGRDRVEDRTTVASVVLAEHAARRGRLSFRRGARVHGSLPEKVGQYVV